MMVNREAMPEQKRQFSLGLMVNSGYNERLR